MQEELKNVSEGVENQQEEATGINETEADNEVKVGDSEALAVAEEKITELNNKILRLQADFDNFRRRTAQDKQQLSGFITAGVVEKFLRVLDNFERAEASAEKTADLESMLTGMKQIRRQFDVVFKELGVEEIAAEGQKFDPNMHEDVMQAQDASKEDDTVALVLEKGYRLSDRVIRHSKVSVVVNK